MIEELPGIDGADEGTRGTAVNHRMREVTELVAAGGTWDDLLVGEVRALFDSLAPEWTATRDHPTRNAPVLDALERGAVVGRTVLELGAGTCISAEHVLVRRRGGSLPSRRRFCGVGQQPWSGDADPPVL